MKLMGVWWVGRRYGDSLMWSEWWLTPVGADGDWKRNTSEYTGMG